MLTGYARRLSSAKFCTIHAKFKLEKVQVASTGDFAAGALSAVINTPETNELIVRSWFLKAGSQEQTPTTMSRT